MKIENLDGLSNQVGNFDQAVETKLFFGSEGNPQSMDRWKGVFNMGTGQVAQVVSKGYQIIQHNDVVQSVVESLGNLNIQVDGLVRNQRDRVKLDLVFQNQGVPIKDDATGCKLGIRAVNSYDKSSSFRLEMFAYRMICSNGMALGNMMGVREVTFHVGEKKPLEKIKEITERFVKEVINSSEKLQEYVSFAMEDSIEWDLTKKLITKLMGGTQCHIKAIEERLEEVKDNLTRWDVYNAMTEYLTHDQQLKPSVVDMLERKSRVVLGNMSHKLEMMVEVEQ